jgi:hypothetical protein
MIKYEFPCYPGDEVWYIESFGGNHVYTNKDKVQMVGFTTRSIQIKLRNNHNFNKTYTWGKSVFATREAAEIALKQLLLHGDPGAAE